MPGTSLIEANENCFRWAQYAKNRGSHQLVVAFEGLAAFKKKAGLRLYAYHDELLKNGDAPKPKNTRMAYVTDNILINNLKENFLNSDFLILPYKRQGNVKSIAFKCVSRWHEVHKGQLRLILLGHSFGGPAAKRLMNTLDKELPQLKIAGMLSIDPRLKSKFVTAKNVKKHYVYYQKGFLRGYPYKDPRGKGYTYNFPVKGKLISGPEGNNHANLTLFEGVQNTYKMLIKE